MALYDAILRGTAGLAKGAFGATAAFARSTPGGFMMTGGAIYVQSQGCKINGFL